MRGFDPLGMLETFGIFMLLAIFVFACCSFCCERARSHRGEVLEPPNPDMIVIEQPTTTSSGRGSRWGQQQLKRWRIPMPRY